MSEFFVILKKAVVAWFQDQATTHAAALAYYMIFSIAPLVLIAIALAGIFFGEEASRGEIFSTLIDFYGPDAADTIQNLIKATALKNTSILATVLGVVTLLIGSSAVFAQLQVSLNHIWKVKSKSHANKLWAMVRQRLISFSLVLVIALLLMASLIMSTIIAVAGRFAEIYLPGGEALWQLTNTLFSFAMTTFLFSAIFKILPDAVLAWKDVWVGGMITALFFNLGQLILGMYLGHRGVTSAYGAAGSAVIILLWTFYTSAILLFGAEFTRFYSLSHHRLVNKFDYPQRHPRFSPGF